MSARQLKCDRGTHDKRTKGGEITCCRAENSFGTTLKRTIKKKERLAHDACLLSPLPLRLELEWSVVVFNSESRPSICSILMITADSIHRGKLLGIWGKNFSSLFDLHEVVLIDMLAWIWWTFDEKSLIFNDLPDFPYHFSKLIPSSNERHLKSAHKSFPLNSKRPFEAR